MSAASDAQAESALAQITASLSADGLLPGRHFGLSLRLAEERFLLRGFQGSEILEPSKSLDGQAALHHQVYRRRRDVNAIVFCQVASLSALVVAGKTLAACVPHCDYYALGTIDGAPLPKGLSAIDALAGIAESQDAVIVGRLGLLCLGQTPALALARVRELAFVARLTLEALTLDCSSPPLSEREVVRGQAFGRELGLASAASCCERCNVCELGHLAHRKPGNADAPAALKDWLSSP